VRAASSNIPVHFVAPGCMGSEVFCWVWGGVWCVDGLDGAATGSKACSMHCERGPLGGAGCPVRATGFGFRGVLLCGLRLVCGMTGSTGGGQQLGEGQAGPCELGRLLHACRKNAASSVSGGRHVSKTVV